MDTLTTAPVALDSPAAPAATPGITPGQQTFIQNMQDQVGKFLSTKLDGPFQAFNYPSGFHKVLMVGNDGYYNPRTLLDIDKLVDEGQPLRLDPTATFSGMYAELINGAKFQFSKADAELIAQEEGDAQEVIPAILSAFTSEVEDFPAGTTNKVGYVYAWLQTNYAGNTDNLPPMYSELQNALGTYESKAVNSIRLNKELNDAMTRLAAAAANVTNPSAANGGLQTGATTWYPAYSLPDAQALSGSLETATNAVDVHLAISDFSSSSSQVSMSGYGSFGMGIADIFDFGGSGDAQYNSSQFSSSDAAMTIDINYPGVTTFSVSPVALSADNKTGWYDHDIVEGLMNNSGQDKTGYALISTTQYPVAEYFGTGKAFAHMRTFVLSQQPTITLTLSGSNSSQLSKDLTANANTEVDIMGLFHVGGSGSYQTHSIDDTSSQGSVTVTFGPTPDGSDPAGQVAYVMGGVVSYPPAS
ncbi:hypothetical protein SAMN02745146_2768 [Hymenobacter daecheongensis DSM 21074]|uniref:Uncharacterized protein n=1 Tax=Hymenobacter daecheongensis DSM 21074 TaxID=1121955 RepID=A0A1M6I2Q8_9BACT|nr:hypothetical protein [Hymenobacter daecheongensis]SHJ28783.1 hypothetical protein SAMN02745146_2768 [Hymenobacter daecheongensis DSM 21074]